ncbi:hypothetical protein OHS70_32560 [Streptomyces sp. NBC_00390]|uniref:hypothetical protein n=1 Tax=Streptomyces sp. NBC_00390 TaxID=2975736 RepID=UPI002E1D797D
MSPKPKSMPAARMLAENYVFLVRPPAVLEVFDRMVRAWRSARARTITVLSIAELAEIFRAEDALPSQWLPLLEAIPVKQWCQFTAATCEPRDQAMPEVRMDWAVNTEHDQGAYSRLLHILFSPRSDRPAA